jgi:hypothetical protein
MYICTNKQTNTEIMYNTYTTKNGQQPRVWKGLNENQELVWHTFDAREGDTFQSETYAEAIKVWIDLMPLLNKNQQQQMFNS